MNKQKSLGMIAMYSLLLAGVVAAMFMLRECSTSASQVQTVEKISTGDTIDVAIEYSPASIYIKSDTLGGLNYDIMRQVAQIVGQPVKYHPVTSLEETFKLLEKGVYDIIVADIPLTIDFQQRYRLSEPVYLDKQVLLQHIDTAKGAENEEISSVLDLAGRQVWVVAGTPAEERLKALAEEIGDTIYVENSEEYGSELLAMLTSIGEIRLCVVNEKVAKAMAKDSPTVKISTDISFTQFQAWCMRNDDHHFAAKIDSALIQFKSTPEYQALLKRYKN